MLELFETSAREAGVVPSAVLGSWPDVADQVRPVDVAVSHHALYSVAEIEPFLRALTDRARHRGLRGRLAETARSTGTDDELFSTGQVWQAS